MSKATIEEIKGKTLTWLHLSKAGKEELAALKKRFGFLDIDLDECPPPLQRSTLAVRPTYFFMILLFPMYDRKTGQLKISEVDCFVSRDALVTVNLDHLAPIAETMAKMKKDHSALSAEGPGQLLYHLLDGLLESCLPMLTHIANDIGAVEERMSDVHNRKTIFEIFRIKTNITNFKKAIQPHKAVMRKLIGNAPALFPTTHLMQYFEHLVEHTKEIWDDLETNANTIGAVEDTHLSLLNFRTNDTMRVLTIFAVLTFPLTVFAGLFGMNTVATPIVGHPYDFWIILGIMAAGICAMVAYFRWKKWL